MCNAAEHAFKVKSAKLLILLSLRTIYFRTFQSETPCRSKNVGHHLWMFPKVEFIAGYTKTLAPL